MEGKQMTKRPPQPKPGEPGGVRWNYDGPIMYVDGQYYDPEEKKYVNLETGEYFNLDDPYIEESSEEAPQEEPTVTSHFLSRAANANHNDNGDEAIRNLREKLKKRHDNVGKRFLSRFGL
jgi:hypothetical protein